MKRWIVYILVCAISLLSGCWDMRELDDLGLVMVVGIDKIKETNNFRITAQIAKPSGAGQAKGDSGGDEPVWTGSAEGNSIFEAIRNLAKFSSRRIMWAHNNVVIIGETLAREDITPVIDFFTRNQELRMRTWVAVSKGDAREYVAAKTGIETIPGMSLSAIFRYAELPAETVRTEMLDVFRDFLSDAMQPVIARLELKERLISAEAPQEQGGQTQVVLEGTAAFKGKKMVGWISPEESRALGWIRGENKKAVLAVPCPGEEGRFISVELTDIGVEFIAEAEQEIPKMNILFSVKGEIAEMGCLSEMPIEEVKKAVEEKVRRQIVHDMKASIHKVQKEYETDVLGFGRIIHIQNREEWYRRIKPRYDELYPKIPVTLNVKVDIHTSKLYQEPLRLEQAQEESQ